MWESIHVVPKPWEKHILFPFLKCAIYKALHSAQCWNMCCLLVTISAWGAGDKLSLASVHCALLHGAGEAVLVALLLLRQGIHPTRVHVMHHTAFGLPCIRKTIGGRGCLMLLYSSSCFSLARTMFPPVVVSNQRVTKLNEDLSVMKEGNEMDQNKLWW